MSQALKPLYYRLVKELKPGDIVNPQGDSVVEVDASHRRDGLVPVRLSNTQVLLLDYEKGMLPIYGNIHKASPSSAS